MCTSGNIGDRVSGMLLGCRELGVLCVYWWCPCMCGVVNDVGVGVVVESGFIVVVGEGVVARAGRCFWWCGRCVYGCGCRVVGCYGVAFVIVGDGGAEPNNQ